MFLLQEHDFGLSASCRFNFRALTSLVGVGWVFWLLACLKLSRSFAYLVAGFFSTVKELKRPKAPGA